MNRTPHRFKYPMVELSKALIPFRDDIERAIKRVLDSGVFVGGEEVAEFENEFARYIGLPYAVGVASGLDALRLTLRALVLLGRLNEGDEVIVPSNTYIASVLAVIDAGLKPVLLDPSLKTMNLSAEGVRRAMTRNTRAIMPVHLYGRLSWEEEMRHIVEEYDLIVVEDCAQAIGVEYRREDGRTVRAGAIGTAGCFSFYPTKNLGCLGDGGMIVTADKELAETVRALGNYGSDRRYHNIFRGFNSRLDPLQAAVLKVRFRAIDEINSGRRRRAKIYDENIRNPLIELPDMPEYEGESVWHQYVVRVKNANRDRFRKMLQDTGVETDVHYPTPIHLQPCYKFLSRSDLPVAERLAGEVVSLPIGDHLTAEEIGEISKIINLIR